LPSVRRKKLTVDFAGGNQSSNGGVLLLREAGVNMVFANPMCERCVTAGELKMASYLSRFERRREPVWRPGAAGRANGHHPANASRPASVICTRTTSIGCLPACTVSDVAVRQPFVHEVDQIGRKAMRQQSRFGAAE